MHDEREGGVRYRLGVPAGISLIYIVVALSWIAFSDAMLDSIFGGMPGVMKKVGTLKGFFFVLVTGGLLYGLLVRRERQIRAAHALLGESERHYRELFVSNPLPMWIFDPQSLAFLKVNDAAIDLYGYSESEFLSMRISDIRPPEDVPALLAAVRSTGRQSFSKTGGWRHRRKDGSLLDVVVFSHALEYEGRPARFVVVYDLTEAHAAQRALRESEARYARVIEGSDQGFWDWDLKSDRFTVSPRFETMLGYAPGEMDLRTENWVNVVHPDDFAPNMASVERHLAGETPHHEFELRLTTKSGGWLWVLSRGKVVARDEAGQPLIMSGTHTDISRLKASEERLDFLAYHDPLTALPNRLLAAARLEHALDLARREERQLALLMLDLDRFKDVNDSFGHAVGDQLLRQVARRLQERLRGADTFSRLGGDEFTVLLEHLARPEDAARVAGELIVALDEPWLLPNGSETRIGASIGISLFPDHGDSAETLLQHADAAMYRAKAEGRGRYQYFSEDLTHAARGRIDMEVHLRRAIGLSELRVHFQPQVDIGSGRIVGAEALVRWQRGDVLVPPGSFIPLAEETGLIRDIGLWVLRETCRQGRQWLDAGLPQIVLAVNVSAHQIRHGDFCQQVFDVLAETGFPPGLLELELTESALMDEHIAVAAMLDRLRERRIRLAIDDFGTGYSSLAYLKRFPLDVLKIDKRFVDDIAHDRDDREIAMAIIGMGHTLGFKVLAEGVEAVEQLAFLEAQGCDLYQGYYHSRPLPAAEFARLFGA